MSTLDLLNDLASSAAALRQVVRLQPAGGPYTKVYPAQYAGGNYAFEVRYTPEGQEAPCVLLDSVASQANRLEEALLAATRSGRVFIPHIEVALGDIASSDLDVITDLQTPNRYADAIIRDSVDEQGIRFKDTDIGRYLASATRNNATPLLRYAPSGLLFGSWDSFNNISGAKFQRLIISEIVGFYPLKGVQTSSRRDPLNIEDNADVIPIYRRGDDWTLDESEADKDEKGRPIKVGKSGEKPGRPSQIGHGNVLPVVEDTRGGVSIRYAVRNCVFSISALRQLRFPLDGNHNPDLDLAARSTLLAMGLLSVALLWDKGLSLRSGCDLVPEHQPVWEVIRPGHNQAGESFTLDAEAALELFNQAKSRLAELGLVMSEQPVRMYLSDKVVALARGRR